MRVTTFDLLAGHPFLEGLPRPWLESLSFQAYPALYQGGDRLFHESYPADRFWLVRSGEVALDTPVTGEGDVVIDVIGAGGVVGWSWLFPPYRWHFGAVATQRSTVIKLNAAGVRRLMDEDHALGHELTARFMRVVVDRLQSTRARLLNRHAEFLPGELAG